MKQSLLFHYEFLSREFSLGKLTLIWANCQVRKNCPITSTVFFQFNVARTQVSNQVRNLSLTLDSRLSFDANISALSKCCFYHIRALRHIRPNLTLDCSKNIACSFVGCRLDYANSTIDSWLKVDSVELLVAIHL